MEQRKNFFVNTLITFLSIFLGFLLFLWLFKNYQDFHDLRRTLKETWNANYEWYDLECVHKDQRLVKFEPETVKHTRIQKCEEIKLALNKSIDSLALYKVANDTFAVGGNMLQKTAMSIVMRLEHPFTFILTIIGAIAVVLLICAIHRTILDAIPFFKQTLPIYGIKKKSE